MWGATHYKQILKNATVISIHAPRVGSDLHDSSLLHQCIYFNPRSPCGERPLYLSVSVLSAAPFQSTLPVWGATEIVPHLVPDFIISIHAPRVGSDPEEMGRMMLEWEFQSTLPVWGATDNRA